MGTVAAEIKQIRPFAQAEEELFVTLVRTTDLLRHAADRALKPFGISPEQYNVLRILAGAPDGHPTLEVGGRLISRATNITRLVDKMIAKRLVRRERRSDDRRVVVTRITPRGLKLLKEATPVLRGSIQRMLSCLSDVQMRDAIESLDRIRAHVRNSILG